MLWTNYLRVYSTRIINLSWSRVWDFGDKPENITDGQLRVQLRSWLKIRYARGGGKNHDTILSAERCEFAKTPIVERGSIELSV